MIDVILELLNLDPYSLNQSEKDEVFLEAMEEASKWHYQHSEVFKKLCDSQNFSPFENFSLEGLPFIPIPLFKKIDLLSVPSETIVKTLFSSGTSGQPSKVMIDHITSERQSIALRKIMSDFLGKERRHFIIFDEERVIKSSEGELKSRATAIRGMLQFAKKTFFILNSNLEPDIEKLKEYLNMVKEGEKVCFFGFTWLIYNVIEKFGPEIKVVLDKIEHNDCVSLHIGGWKKLQEKAVSKEEFNTILSKYLNVKREKIVDFYGMTEQLGTVYPDCEFNYKHVPIYSDIIIRDLSTLKPVKIGKSGLIQLLSPIPHSYPGISLLSEDVGTIVGVDNCPCGRKGKYFLFNSRLDKAEAKGCGDTLKV